MIQATLVKEEQSFIPGFAASDFDALKQQAEPALLASKREEAYASYTGLPTPTVRTEEWRKTDPALFPFDKLTRAARLTEVDQPDDVEWDEHFDVVVTVSDKGYAVHDRAGIVSGEKVTVLALDRAAEERPELIEKYLQGRALPPGRDKFTALNAAFWNVGFVIHVAQGVEIENGILVRYRFEDNGTVMLPRLLAVVEDRAQAMVVEHFESPDDITMASVIAKELYVGEGGRLRMLTLQEWGEQTYQIENDMAVVQRDGQVDWITLNLGSKISKMKFGSDVAGAGSTAELDGLFLSHGTQHLDQTTEQIHSSPDTYSRLLYKGAVTDKSHSVYRGIIQAKPGAIRVDAYQTNNNLVLSDEAHADTIPGLLIDADDLACSHGATIGNLDDDQIFYLRSRGLDEVTARQICIMGFFEEIIERIPYAFIRDRLHETIERRTSAGLA